MGDEDPLNCQDLSADKDLMPIFSASNSESAFRDPLDDLNPVNEPTSSDDDGIAEKRHAGRLQCPYLDCFMGSKRFGEVVDLSAQGIRLFRKGGFKWRVGQSISITLRWHEDQVAVTARILRARKVGFRRHDVGLQFVDPSLEVQAAITSLARGARYTLQFMGDRDVA